jgi:hypothetical protein
MELPLTFGLGGEETVESLEITWPDGSTETVQPDSVDRLLVVQQAPSSP